MAIYEASTLKRVTCLSRSQRHSKWCGAYCGEFNNIRKQANSENMRRGSLKSAGSSDRRLNCKYNRLRDFNRPRPSGKATRQLPFRWSVAKDLNSPKVSGITRSMLSSVCEECAALRSTRLNIGATPSNIGRQGDGVTWPTPAHTRLPQIVVSSMHAGKGCALPIQASRDILPPNPTGIERSQHSRLGTHGRCQSRQARRTTMLC